jgi:hypothetical protein
MQLYNYEITFFKVQNIITNTGNYSEGIIITFVPRAEMLMPVTSYHTPNTIYGGSYPETHLTC